jgi:MoxR-like ATPase
MTRQEALAKADSTTDPLVLQAIYQQFKSDGQVVSAVVFNKFCPDEIKKEYVHYAIAEKFPNYQQLTGDTWFQDALNALKKSLEAWQPIQKLSELPKWDTEDKDAAAIADVLEKHKREVILYGPPGTSKTRLARMVAARLAEDDHARIRFVQFHPSYGYEDFIEGIVPKEVGGQVSFRLQNKVFKQCCGAARKASDKRFVLIIDEINRADLSKVMGELFTCLEYRGASVHLLYSSQPFQIPANVYIIGTMNTLDRSTFDIDYALRRRFYFYEVPPSETRLRNIMTGNEVDPALQDLVVAAFTGTRGQGYEMGHAYFKDVKQADDVRTLWLHQLKPLLEQYFSTERSKVTATERLFQAAWAAGGTP